MPVVNPEVVQLLKDKKHAYISMSQDELLKIAKASSHQDAGNYGGQLVTE